MTYNQMWNICMREALPNRNNFQQKTGAGFSSFRNTTVGHSGGSNQHSKKKKSDYCWNFNKGLACKYGKKCRFVERCSFCDSETHGVVTQRHMG